MAFGAGLGSFMSGLAQGVQGYAAMKSDIGRAKLQDMQIKNLEQQQQDQQALRQIGQDAGKAMAGTDGTIESMAKVYNEQFVPKYYQQYLQNGDVEKANAFRTYIQNENVQQGLKYGSSFMRAVQLGDAEGAMGSMVKLFNQPGYFENGWSAVNAKLTRDKDGNAAGMDITLKNDATGETTTHTFKTLEDAYRTVMPFTDPKNVFDYATQQIAASTKAKAEMQKEDRAWNRDLTKMQIQQGNTLESQANQSQLRRAEEAEKQRNGGGSNVVRDAKAKEEYLRSRGVPEDRIKSLAPQMVGLENQGVPITKRIDTYITEKDKDVLDKDWQKLSASEKTERAVTELKARDEAASGYYGGQGAGLTPQSSQQTQGAQPRMALGYDTKTGKPVMIPVK
ncbi:virion structural protein [Klebsiella phage LASTA]|uniref:Uncharacterized protein n=2 Tax=Lastavirus lasta TaxID=2845090 RepID=A0A6H0X3B5_9CAUD|nr:virion structural protein [Klebsiella phage LASTA]QIW86629.1 hypothetical protein 24149LASTA_00002 [Klebsiella phage LASTA]QIW86705.1 hypothetical protein 24147SJM3_00002 [Klebsiella phage SJM3]